MSNQEPSEGALEIMWDALEHQMTAKMIALRIDEFAAIAVQAERDRIARQVSRHSEERLIGPTVVPVIAIMNIVANPKDYP